MYCLLPHVFQTGLQDLFDLGILGLESARLVSSVRGEDALAAAHHATRVAVVVINLPNGVLW